MRVTHFVLMESIMPQIARVPKETTLVLSAFHKILDFVAALEVKDFIAIVAACVASASFIVAMASYRQRSKEGALALRKQLSDSMQKLLDLNTESAKRDLEPAKYPTTYGGLLNDQRRFHANVALYLIDRLHFKVSRWELQTVARAFATLTDYAEAERLYLRAVQKKGSAIENAVIARGYSRFLFQAGEQERGRRVSSTAFRYLDQAKNMNHERGFTYEFLASSEWYFGEKRLVADLLDQAIGFYKEDKWEHRGAESVSKLKSTPMWNHAQLERTIASQIENHDG